MVVIRNELSKKNRYYLSKHRFLELKHFCLQYPEWKRLYLEGRSFGGSLTDLKACKDVEWSDPTANAVIFRENLAKKMKLVEDTIHETDPGIEDYIFKAVTEDLSYTYLRTVLNIPCSKNYYYDKYRKFFYILSLKLA